MSTIRPNRTPSDMLEAVDRREDVLERQRARQRIRNALIALLEDVSVKDPLVFLDRLKSSGLRVVDGFHEKSLEEMRIEAARAVEMLEGTSIPKDSSATESDANLAEREKIENNSLHTYGADYNNLSTSVKMKYPWKYVVNRLKDFPEKWEKARRLQGGGELFSIDYETGELCFKDSGEEPVKYIFNKKMGQIIEVFYGRIVEKQRDLDDTGKPEYATRTEIEARVEEDGYELFEAEGDKPSQLMLWAGFANESTGPNYVLLKDFKWVKTGLGIHININSEPDNAGVIRLLRI